MTPGERIKSARKSKGLTQQKLSELCGWEESKSRVSNYENNRSEPNLADFRRLAKALKVNPGWLAFGED